MRLSVYYLYNLIVIRIKHAAIYFYLIHVINVRKSYPGCLGTSHASQTAVTQPDNQGTRNNTIFILPLGVLSSQAVFHQILPSLNRN